MPTEIFNSFSEISEPKAFTPPEDAIETLEYKDFKIYVAQNPYQHAPGNTVTYRAMGWRPADGVVVKLGNPQNANQTNHTGSGFDDFKSAKDVIKAMLARIDRTTPLPRYDIPLPDYEGFNLNVSKAPPETGPCQSSQRFVGRASRNGFVIEEEAMYSQDVINRLRLRIDRYVGFGLFGDKYEI